MCRIPRPDGRGYSLSALRAWLRVRSNPESVLRTSRVLLSRLLRCGVWCYFCCCGCCPGISIGLNRARCLFRCRGDCICLNRRWIHQAVPTITWRLTSLVKSLEDQISDRVCDPVVVELAHRRKLCVRSRIHEIDRVGNIVLDSKLDGVQVITERSAKGAHVFSHAVSELRRQVVGIVYVLFARKVSLARVVRHDHHFFLAHAVTAHELFELNSGLQGHTESARLVVLLQQLFN